MRKYIFLMVLSCSIINISAQDKSSSIEERIEILLKDGSKIVGKLIEESKDQIVIESDILGRIHIDRSKIERINFLNIPIPGSDNSNKFPVDFHNSTHYLANPSGFTLKKGQKILREYWRVF